MNELPWFRCYTSFMDHPLVQMLSFDDQRHLVVIWCMKRAGMLDKEYARPELRERVICAKLGLDPVSAGEAKRRIGEVGLIDDQWQPKNWEERQPSSDSSAERVRRHREKKAKERNADVTLHARSGNVVDKETESEEEPDPESDPESDRVVDVRARTREGDGIIWQAAELPPPGSVDLHKHTPTAEAAMAIPLIEAGVQVTSMHPTLVAWVADGFTLERVKEALALARQQKPEPQPIAANYLDKILRAPPRGPPLKRMGRFERMKAALHGGSSDDSDSE